MAYTLVIDNVYCDGLSSLFPLRWSCFGTIDQVKQACLHLCASTPVNMVCVFAHHPLHLIVLKLLQTGRQLSLLTDYLPCM